MGGCDCDFTIVEECFCEHDVVWSLLGGNRKKLEVFRKDFDKTMFKKAVFFKSGNILESFS